MKKLPLLLLLFAFAGCGQADAAGTENGTPATPATPAAQSGHVHEGGDCCADKAKPEGDSCCSEKPAAGGTASGCCGGCSAEGAAPTSKPATDKP